MDFMHDIKTQKNARPLTWQEMFFLPAELVKEAGNEVLIHWMVNLGMSQDVSFTLGHIIQFFFSCRQCNSFPTLPPLSELLRVVFLCCSLQFCYCDVDRKANINSAVALSCGRQNAFSVWYSRLFWANHSARFGSSFRHMKLFTW